MNGKRETGIAVIAGLAMVIILILGVSILCGCKTKTVVEREFVTIHDTLVSVRTDTIKDVRVTHHTDTVRATESHFYTLNNVGDTVKEIHHYHDLWHTTVVDSTYRYKALVDSLKQALRESQSKEKVVTKTKHLIRWWEYVVLLGIVGVILFFVLKRGGRTFVDKI